MNIVLQHLMALSLLGLLTILRILLSQVQFFGAYVSALCVRERLKGNVTETERFTLGIGADRYK